MMIGNSDFGPFAAAVGYVIALGSTIGAFAITWRGKLQKWKPPEEVLPAAAQRVAILLSMVFVALAFFYARPDLLEKMYWWSAKLGIAVFVAFIIYTILIETYRFPNVAVKDRQTGRRTRRDILGGLWLTNSARRQLRDGTTTPDGKHIPPPSSVEVLLEGVGGDLSRVWSKFSRALSIAAADALFIAILFLGNIAVGCAGFALQVQLTGKPAAPMPITDKSGAPPPAPATHLSPSPTASPIDLGTSLEEHIARLQASASPFADRDHYIADVTGKSVDWKVSVSEVRHIDGKIQVLFTPKEGGPSGSAIFDSTYESRLMSLGPGDIISLKGTIHGEGGMEIRPTGFEVIRRVTPPPSREP